MAVPHEATHTACAVRGVMIKTRTAYPVEWAPDVVVTGVPHSGTWFTYILLRNAGVNVTHEVARKVGTIDWMYPVRNQDVSPRVVLHQVRNPYKVIQSLSALKETIWDARIYPNMPILKSEPWLVQRTKLWLYWSAVCEALSTATYRVEDETKAAFVLADAFNIDQSRIDHSKVDHAINSHPTDLMPLSDQEMLDALPPAIARALRKSARGFGYDAE